LAYCIQQDLIDRFGEDELLDATDRDRDGSVDQAVLDQAIADADADIERHLRGRYLLPVQDAGALDELKRIACDLTRFYLWGIQAPEHVAERYKAAQATLKDYAKGTITLDATPAETGAQPPRGVAVVAPAQVFTADQLQKLDVS